MSYTVQAIPECPLSVLTCPSLVTREGQELADGYRSGTLHRRCFPSPGNGNSAQLQTFVAGWAVRVSVFRYPVFQFPGVPTPKSCKDTTLPTYPSPPHAFQVLENIGSASGATDASGDTGSSSVGGPQNGPHLGMLEHVFPQAVIMTGAHPGEPPVRE